MILLHSFLRFLGTGWTCWKLCLTFFFVPDVPRPCLGARHCPLPVCRQVCVSVRIWQNQPTATNQNMSKWFGMFKMFQIKIWNLSEIYLSPWAEIPGTSRTVKSSCTWCCTLLGTWLCAGHRIFHRSHGQETNRRVWLESVRRVTFPLQTHLVHFASFCIILHTMRKGERPLTIITDS